MARILFFLSLASSLYWLCGMYFEAALRTEPPLYAYFAVSVLLAILIAAVVFRVWPSFLSPTGDPVAALKRYLLWSVALYCLSLPVGAVLAYLYLVVDARGLPQLNHDSRILLWSTALWLPLWWAPAVGVSVGWLRIKRERSAR